MTPEERKEVGEAMTKAAAADPQEQDVRNALLMVSATLLYIEGHFQFFRDRVEAEQLEEERDVIAEISEARADRILEGLRRAREIIEKPPEAGTTTPEGGRQ